VQIFDTHCHYNLEPLYSGQAIYFDIDSDDPILQKKWHDHWHNAQKNGIKKTLIPGAGLGSSRLAVEIAQQEQNLYASVAIHPLRVKKIEFDSALKEIKSLSQEKSVIAIGETGLDYFHFTEKDEIEKIKKDQKKLFIEQIKLAIKRKLTLIIHARDKNDEAYWQILEILDQYWPAEENIIFHCLSGPMDYVTEAMKINNSYFGFDGNLTFKNANYLRTLFQLINKKYPDKILLETDAPYLAPAPYRGQICQPAMISELAKFVEKNMQGNLRQIYQNSLKAFKLEDDG
jgi:TatD DNase family protein